MADRDRQRATRCEPGSAAVIEHLAAGILVVGPDERVQLLNAAGARMLDSRPVSGQGPLLVEVIRLPAFLDLVGEVSRTGQPHERRVTLVVPAGERELALRGVPLPDAGGEPSCVLVEMSDITRLQRLEVVRREFVANVSHELNTPVTAIRGFSEVLHDQPDMPLAERRHYLAIVRRQAERLQALIEDLLVLSSLEREPGLLRESIVEQALRPLLEAAVACCVPLPVTEQVPVQVACAEDLRWPVAGELLEQAIINLVDNALKHSGTSTPIIVSAEVREGQLLVRVTDRGRGIESRHLPRLFERFYRVDRDRSRRRGGTGLGLSIVKHVARAHGGEATVTSRPGEGTVVALVLPGGQGRSERP